jgi:hypothetical protein
MKRAVIIFFLFALLLQRVLANKAVINLDLVLEIDGKKIFPIGFTLPPPPEGKTPDGKNGIAELADAGATFLRTGGPWSAATLEREQKYMDAAARYGMHCLPFLRENAAVTSPQKEEALRKLINRFKDHPGLGAWKGEDEPEWGKRAIEPLLKGYQVIKEADPNHPMVIIHAPHGTVESLGKYNVSGDIIGADIYPVSYPMGIHSLVTNYHRGLGLVGDYTRLMSAAGGGKMPVWMVLQISWSGVLKPGKTLRMPTFPEERFMTYEAIINGARGLVYFGGNNEGAMTEEDKKLGWNWRFWQRVLRPVVEEIGSKSLLYPALVAPNSKLAVKAQANGELDGKIEFCVREVGNDLFILACKGEGTTGKVKFSGLPVTAGKGDVLYEEPRTVEAKGGEFTEWFGPYEVHVYRFAKAADGK